jgi:hypothetical protein
MLVRDLVQIRQDLFLPRVPRSPFPFKVEVSVKGVGVC